MAGAKVDYQQIIDDGLRRPLGPRETCPACTSKLITAPKYCTPEKPIATGIFRRCDKGDKHLHQKCKRCGMAWICGPAEFER